MSEEYTAPYGIIKVTWALNTVDEFGERDIYGVEIDYYHKATKIQGRVKLTATLIPVELLQPTNDALNEIVGWALARTSPKVVLEPTDHIVGQTVGEPYPDTVLQPDRLDEHNSSA